MKITNINSGMTLIEILLAIIIITVGAVGMLKFYIATIDLSEVNKEETIAVGHLSNMMEAIKCTPFSNITADFPNGVSGGTATNDYSKLTGSYVLTGEQITVSFVNPNSDPLEITASVTWRDIRGANHTKYLVTKKTK